MNVMSVERLSVIVQLLLDTRECTVERGPMSVMCVGKLSAIARIFWDTEESTLERSHMNAMCVEKLSDRAHTSLYISKSTLKRSPGNVQSYFPSMLIPVGHQKSTARCRELCDHYCNFSSHSEILIEAEIDKHLMVYQTRH